uniref:Uncharacterized protein n=1 Tax=Cacopsylla melanoneura TaxID=428564 RepID=A0A8D8VA71_9HEMI
MWSTQIFPSLSMLSIFFVVCCMKGQVIKQYIILFRIGFFCSANFTQTISLTKLTETDHIKGCVIRQLSFFLPFLIEFSCFFLHLIDITTSLNLSNNITPN